MKKVRKGKKMLITALIVVIVVIAIILIVVQVRKNNKPSTPTEEDNQVIALPKTTYSGMEVSNIYMEYLKDNNDTMITMTVTNTTSQKVEKEVFNTILIGDKENVLGQMGYTTISNLDVGEQHNISVIYKGDLTGTKQIKLEKMQ